jgi:N-acetylglucosaminyldiphosphoundecaprenol N-acetyl-beta-D-mannosaminyltransferase
MTCLKSPAFDTFDVLGVPISVTTLDTATEAIRGWSADETGRFVCIRDVHGVMLCQDDPALLRIHQEASMVTPDGMPLVFIGQRRGKEVRRTCGPDLMQLVCDKSLGWGGRHYLYGGAEGVADELASVLRGWYPGIKIVGIESPPFRQMTPEEDDAAVKRIVDSDADIVWVGLSTPKQERWMYDHVGRLPATLIGVGAAFDFHTGRVKQAPKWMQRSALEWLHRLMSEPRRLWRRYLVLAPKFVWAVLTQPKHRSG